MKYNYIDVYVQRLHDSGGFVQLLYFNEKKPLTFEEVRDKVRQYARTLGNAYKITAINYY